MASSQAVFVKILGNFFSKFILQKKGIEKLQGVSDTESILLRKALQSVVRDEFSEEEREIFHSIENLRKQLSASKELVVYQDFCSPSNTSYSSPLKNFASIGKSGDWALLLFKIIRFLEPRNCLELGTCLGFSAAYEASALKLNQKGHLITLECQQSLSVLADNNLRNLQLNNYEIKNGLFHDTLDDVLKNLETIDYVFIDGHHDEKETYDYFNRIYPYLSNNAVVIFDDISWSTGMKKFWNRIIKDPRITNSLNLLVIGIVISSKREES